MKNKMLLVGLMAAVVSGPAVAADLPVKAYRTTPAPAYFNWSGLYIGGHAGGGWGRPAYTNVVNTSTFGGALPGQSFNQSSSGFIGGGQIGYNWQVSQWVYGLEASYSGSTVRKTTTNFVDDNFTNKLNGLLLVTARAGYAFNNSLLYVKGGYAGASRRVSVSDTALVSPGVGSGSATAWNSGWTVGAGAEYGLSANWIVGLEYDYARFGNKRYELDGTDVGGLSYLFNVKADYHIVTGRLSYKFN